MGRKRQAPTPKPGGAGRWAMAIAAYAIGVACAVVGVLVMVFGGPDPRAGEEATKDAATRLGWGMICLGILAIALIGCLHWLKSRR